MNNKTNNIQFIQILILIDAHAHQYVQILQMHIDNIKIRKYSYYEHTDCI